MSSGFNLAQTGNATEVGAGVVKKATQIQVDNRDGDDGGVPLYVSPDRMPIAEKARVRAYTNANLAVNIGFVKIPYNTESYDLGGDFDTTTNEFTAPRDGYYSINANGRGATLGSSDGAMTIAIYVNGVLYSQATIDKIQANGNVLGTQISDIVSLSQGDTVTVFATCSRSGEVRFDAGEANTYVAISEL